MQTFTFRTMSCDVLSSVFLTRVILTTACLSVYLEMYVTLWLGFTQLELFSVPSMFLSHYWGCTVKVT